VRLDAAVFSGAVAVACGSAVLATGSIGVRVGSVDAEAAFDGRLIGSVMAEALLLLLLVAFVAMDCSSGLACLGCAFLGGGGGI